MIRLHRKKQQQQCIQIVETISLATAISEVSSVDPTYKPASLDEILAEPETPKEVVPVENAPVTPITFKDRAAIVRALSEGATVIPVPMKSKATKVGTKARSHDAEQIAKWNSPDPNQNCAACASYDKGGLWFVDDDLGTLIETIKTETGQDISIYFRVKTANGNHFYFLHDEKSRAVRYGKSENSGVIEVPGYKGEARCNNQYVLGPKSVHPSGHIYQIVNDVPLVPAPDWLLEWLKAKYALSESIKKEKKKVATQPPTVAATPLNSGTPSGAVSTPTGVVIYPDAPNPGFKKLAEAVGWGPLVRRMNESEDGHFHVDDLDFVPGVVFPCPMPNHKHRDYSNCFGIQKSNPALVKCLGNCGFVGDVVKAVFEMDDGPDKKWTMYDAARAICEEEDLTFGDFFQDSDTVFVGGRIAGQTITPFAKESETGVQTNVGLTCLIFEKDEHANVATEAGFDALPSKIALECVEQLKSKYDRIVLFGLSNELTQLRSTFGIMAISVSMPTARRNEVLNKEFLNRVTEMEAVRRVNKKNTPMEYILAPVGATVASREAVEIEPTLELPDSAMASTVLGDIYDRIFQPNGFPLSVALPALVTAASVRVPAPLAQSKSGLVIGEEPMSNLYTAIVAPVHGGKTQVIQWGCKALNIYREDQSPWYLEGNFASSEAMLKYVRKNIATLKDSFLVNPDEWAYLFSKAAIQNATFPFFMTKTFYNRNQTYEIGQRGGSINLHHAISFIGGIVEENFDTVFGAETLGGVYDRFLFGWSEGFNWDYRPYPHPLSLDDLSWTPVRVQEDGSVYEVIRDWNKRTEGIGRITEVCVRVARIFASMDGRSILYGTDIEKLGDLAANQIALRKMFRPNEGINPDAQFANKVIGWLTSKTKGEWVALYKVKNGVHAYEASLGPNVANRALFAMAHGANKRIDLWQPETNEKGQENLTPDGWTGRRPRNWLIRLAAQAGQE